MKPTTSSKCHIALAIAIYIVIWEALALYIDSRVLLVSPVAVITKLFQLVQAKSFWASISFSLCRIFLGLVSALLASLITSALSARFSAFKTMLEPLVMVMKATPVASITILVLIWVSSRNLSSVISFMMVFPVMHTSLYEGIESVDRKIKDMAKVYRVPAYKKIRYIYIPVISSYFLSGITISLGLCFKSGIAAEVIAVPSGSIGEKLYEAKLYLATADLFAWTLTIILLAKTFEKVLLLLIKRILKALEGSL